MIEFKNIYKTFKTKNTEVHALQDVSLTVEKGDIYGVIGFSGAGKSTLIRMVNGLETPTQGTVTVDEKNVSQIKIPSNMYIWATMNTSDQSLFPIDSAFKRRWDFEYIGINAGEEEISTYEFTVKGAKDEKVNWNALRKAINKQLTKIGVNEDKLLGPFFIKKDLMAEGKEAKFVKAFTNKVLMYLFEDAAKYKTDRVFKTKVNGNPNTRFSEILENFQENGLDIFENDIVNEFK